MNTVLKRLIRYVRPYRSYFFFSVIFSVIQTGGSLFLPILIGRAVDCTVGAGKVDFPALKRILCLMWAVIALIFIFQWAAQKCINRFSILSVSDMRKNSFAHLQKVPIKYIDNSMRGDLTQRIINDVEIVSDGLLQGTTKFISGIMTIGGTLAFMFYINFRIAIIVVLLTPLSFIVASRITRASKKAFMQQAELRAQLNAITEEMVGNQELIKDFCYEERSFERFEKVNRQLQKEGARATFYSSLTNPSTRFVNNIIYAAVALIGSLAAIKYLPFGSAALTVGGLTSFLTYANQYTKPFNEISGVVSEFQNAAASSERIFSLLDEAAEEDVPRSEIKADGSLDIRGVSFSYLPTQKLITGFDLSVKPDQKIAIVGPTGCGKTTIINLILRFYDVTEGAICFGGRDIRELNRKEYRENFGMVLQDSWIFTGTVAENIAYSKPDAPREKIVEAAKNAYAHSFIMQLPKGYDTVLTEGGNNLSQGQKQLLCIARIMLVNPEYLILDEATSNIDLRTEQKIQLAFSKLMKGKTSFIIAHRLSTIKNADKILVMDSGEVVEQGSHEELIALNGYYSRLYKSQFEVIS